MKEALGRFLGAAVPIIGVVLLFILVPWLRGGEENENATIRDRLRSDLRSVKENVKTKILNPEESKN